MVVKNVFVKQLIMIPHYNGLVFSPYDMIKTVDCKTPKTLFNTYVGFKASYSHFDDFSLIKPILDHIRIVWV
jgi:hypothetical protein